MSGLLNSPARRVLQNRLIIGGSAIALFAMMAGSASAIDYSFGEVSGSVDTVVTAGASMRTSNRDCRNLGRASGGCKVTDASNSEKDGGTNVDDGNLNYDQWDVFSGAVKATSEAGAAWHNFNAFVRGTAFYDPIIDDVRFRDMTNAQLTGRDGVGHNAKMLDYFVGGSFNVGGMPLELRGGNQVISWGESTFIQNGINVINPIDVAAVRKPGSEVKEFFKPILAAKASLGLPNNFSVEGFYQFKSDNIVPDAAGTFFSGADIVGRGSQQIRAGAFNPGDDVNFNPAAVLDGLSASNVFWQSRLALNMPSVIIERANDKDGDNGGEFGFALRYFNEELNNGMEFGLYFINYHSRLPLVTTKMTNPLLAVSGVTGTTMTAYARDAYGKINPSGSRQLDSQTISAVDLGQFNRANAGLAAGTSADTGLGLPAPTLSASGPVYSATSGTAGANVFELQQQLCNVFGLNGVTAQAQGLQSATGRPWIAGDDARIRSNTDMRLPGGYQNCTNLARTRTLSADGSIAATLANTQQYRLEFPEDIKLFGASVSTTLGSMAFQAEATYRHDQPLSYVGSEVGALASDLDGRTALFTGADLPAGVGSASAPARNFELTPTRAGATGIQYYNQVAAPTAARRAGTNQISSAEMFKLEEKMAGVAGSYSAVPNPNYGDTVQITAGLARAADLALDGLLTVADLPVVLFDAASLGAGGVVLPTSTLAGTGGTLVGPPSAGAVAPFLAKIVGTNGVTVGPTPVVSAINPAGSVAYVFPQGTAAGLVDVANRRRAIDLDPGRNSISSYLVNGTVGDGLYLRHVDSGTGAVATPSTPQNRASVLSAENVGRDGFVKTPKEDIFTAQATMTSVLFGSNQVVQFAAADGGTVVTEVGMVWAPGISTSSAISASGSEGLLNPIAANTYRLNPDLKGPTNWATPFSWGAQGIFNLTYNRVFGSPVNLVPAVGWRWDLGGRTPTPLGNYMAERKAISLSVAANYQSRWTGSVSWTAQFGPNVGVQSDRDFASLNVAYAF